MHTPGVEIERKYRLRTAPPADVVAARESDRWLVEQVYLTRGTDGYHRRIRRIEHADGRVEHLLTRKRAIEGSFAREELEGPIDEETYGALLDEADPTRRPIRKTRHVVPHGDQHLEIDVFAEPAGLVLVEVELGAEDEVVELPEWLGELRQVTDDERYYNANLASADAVVPPFDEPSA